MPPERKSSPPTCPEYTENPYRKTESFLTEKMKQIKRIRDKGQKKEALTNFFMELGVIDKSGNLLSRQKIIS